MAFALRYSFNFRYSKDRLRSVMIPLEKTVGIELHVLYVARLVSGDHELQEELLGEQAADHQIWVSNLEFYHKELERQNETLEIVEVAS